MKILNIFLFPHTSPLRDDPHLLSRKILSQIKKHWKISILVFDKRDKARHIDELQGKNIGNTLRENNIKVEEIPSHLINFLTHNLESQIAKKDLHKNINFINSEYKILAKDIAKELTKHTLYCYKTPEHDKKILDFIYVSPSEQTDKKVFYINPDKIKTCEKNWLKIINSFMKDF